VLVRIFPSLGLFAELSEGVESLQYGSVMHPAYSRVRYLALHPVVFHWKIPYDLSSLLGNFVVVLFWLADGGPEVPRFVKLRNAVIRLRLEFDFLRLAILVENVFA
jgi:hypothetical protein